MTMRSIDLKSIEKEDVSKACGNIIRSLKTTIKGIRSHTDIYFLMNFSSGLKKVCSNANEIMLQDLALCHQLVSGLLL